LIQCGRSGKQTLVNYSAFLPHKSDLDIEHHKVFNLHFVQVFKRSGGISKRNKRSPKPKRASFATATPIDVPTPASDSGPPPSTDQVTTSSSPPTNDRVPAEPEDDGTQGEDSNTQGEDSHPPTQEYTEEPVTRDGLSLELNDPGGDTQR
jgi:hypothetical protein